MIHKIQIVHALAQEYGGPARSVTNLCLASAELGIKVTLLFHHLISPVESKSIGAVRE